MRTIVELLEPVLIGVLVRRFIVLASVLVAVILAGSPATAATNPLPVRYNFLPAAVLGGFAEIL